MPEIAINPIEHSTCHCAPDKESNEVEIDKGEKLVVAGNQVPSSIIASSIPTSQHNHNIQVIEALTRHESPVRLSIPMHSTLGRLDEGLGGKTLPSWGKGTLGIDTFSQTIQYHTLPVSKAHCHTIRSAVTVIPLGH